MVDDHGNRYSGSRFWSRAYADLVDNPVMLPYLEELLGDPAWGHAPPRLPDALRTRIRLDHILVIILVIQTVTSSRTSATGRR